MSAQPTDASTLPAIRPAEPVVDAPAGPKLNLDQLIEATAALGYDSVDQLAASVVDAVHSKQLRDALLQAVTTICRQRYRPAHQPAPRPSTPHPAPAPVPLWQGGFRGAPNLQVLCQTCNGRKG